MAGKSADTTGTPPTPEARLRGFIAKMGAKDQALFRSVRSAVRKRLPAANELVYDYPGNLVISYTPTELGKEGILSIAGRPGDLRLYFGNGPRLPDPKKLLMGSAGMVRYVPVESARRLANPHIEALIAGAIARSGVPLATKGRGAVVIKKDGASQRPRRKPKT